MLDDQDFMPCILIVVVKAILVKCINVELFKGKVPLWWVPWWSMVGIEIYGEDHLMDIVLVVERKPSTSTTTHRRGWEKHGVTHQRAIWLPQQSHLQNATFNTVTTRKWSELVLLQWHAWDVDVPRHGIILTR